MGQNCSKQRKKNSVSPAQDNRDYARPLSKDGALVFLVADERNKLNEKLDSKEPGPSAPAPEREKALDSTVKSHRDVGIQVEIRTSRSRKSRIPRHNRLVCYNSSTDNILPVSEILISRQAKMSDGNTHFLAQEFPAPVETFLAQKMKLSDEELPVATDVSWPLKKVAFDEESKLPFDSSSSSVQELCKTPQTPSSSPLPAKPASRASSQGVCEMPQTPPLSSVPGQSASTASSLVQMPSMTARMAYTKRLMAQMGTQKFQERIAAIDDLVAECNHNPNMVISCIYPVCDAIKSRLLESNRKVNLHMLEALGKIIPLLKDNLAKVVYMLVPAIADNHLNSKSSPIYNAAVGAIGALVKNLDHAHLLKIFVQKAQLLSGHTKGDLAEKVAEMVTELYPRKPQMVEQEVLPLLWHLLSSSTNSRATATLCKALHSEMGARLKMSAVSQPQSIKRTLRELLRTV